MISFFLTTGLEGVVGPTLSSSARDRVAKILGVPALRKQACGLFTEGSLYSYKLLSLDQVVSLCSVSSKSTIPWVVGDDEDDYDEKADKDYDNSSGDHMETEDEVEVDSENY